jgi:hypothetical protein
MRFFGTCRRSLCVSVVRASIVRVSCPPFPDRGREACEDFDSLLWLEAKQEWVILVPDLAEETLEPSPTAIPLGAGLDGKG